MKARIGVADSAKVVEVEVEDTDAFRSDMESAFASEKDVHWFTDDKGHSVGIPVGRIAYVEIETEESRQRVGFAPGT